MIMKGDESQMHWREFTGYIRADLPLLYVVAGVIMLTGFVKLCSYRKTTSPDTDKVFTLRLGCVLFLFLATTALHVFISLLCCCNG